MISAFINDRLSEAMRGFFWFEAPGNNAAAAPVAAATPGAEIAALGSRLEAKRRALVSVMTGRLMGTQGYVFTARHSNNPEIYAPARRGFLADIAARAAADRERNPLYRKMQRLSAAVGDVEGGRHG